MFHWRGPFRVSLRLFQSANVKTESLLDQLKNCTTECQVFQLLCLNRSALTVHHVRFAVNHLWNFQDGKPEKLSVFGQVRNHPEFIVLRTLAQNNIDLLDDKELVDILYTLLKFQVEAHDSLVQQLVVEGWRRLERLDLPTLAKFAICLQRQDLTTSPLLGQIASIVDKNLEDADDPLTLSCLMVCLKAVSSPSLEVRLIEKTESVIHRLDLSGLRHAFRVVRLLHKYKFIYGSLLEKYDNFFKQNIDAMDVKNLSNITALYQQVRLNISDFPLMAKPRLVDMMKTCNDPETLTSLFDALSRVDSCIVRERLEEKLLVFMDEMNLNQLLVVLKAMIEMECKNSAIIEKIFPLLLKNLDVWKPINLLHITEAWVLLPYHNTSLLRKLQSHLQRTLIANFVPNEIAMMAKALSLLDLNRVDKAVISKIDAVIQQFNLSSAEKIAFLLHKLSLKTPRVFENRHKTCRELLQKLNSCALERFHHMDNIDLLLNEVLHIKTKQWMNEELTEGLLDNCQRFLHKVTWRNVAKISRFLIHMNCRRAPLLHTVAAVTMEDITKIHPSNINVVLHPFGVLNYEPPQGREYFNICFQYILEHKNLMRPSCLIQIGYNFALANYFPKELIKAIFNMTFLHQLDDELKLFAHAYRMRFRTFLMELNRAVCIEHPEYQVPWFHESYCQHMKKKEMTSKNEQLQKLFEIFLGGKHYTKSLVTTPYCYSIDFEFMLDKDKKPIPYSEQDSFSDEAIKMCELDGQLPEGAQRFAVELLGFKAICHNKYLKGQSAMKKRHLEILGYHVIQIPIPEWNPLMRTERENQIQYIREKIYAEN